jgi:hypothetical protein
MARILCAAFGGFLCTCFNDPALGWCCCVSLGIAGAMIGL